MTLPDRGNLPVARPLVGARFSSDLPGRGIWTRQWHADETGAQLFQPFDAVVEERPHRFPLGLQEDHYQLVLPLPATAGEGDEIPPGLTWESPDPSARATLPGPTADPHGGGAAQPTTVPAQRRAEAENGAAAASAPPLFERKLPVSVSNFSGPGVAEAAGRTALAVSDHADEGESVMRMDQNTASVEGPDPVPSKNEAIPPATPLIENPPLVQRASAFAERGLAEPPRSEFEKTEAAWPNLAAGKDAPFVSSSAAVERDLHEEVPSIAPAGEEQVHIDERAETGISVSEPRTEFPSGSERELPSRPGTVPRYGPADSNAAPMQRMASGNSQRAALTRTANELSGAASQPERPAEIVQSAPSLPIVPEISDRRADDVDRPGDDTALEAAPFFATPKLATKRAPESNAGSAPATQLDSAISAISPTAPTNTEPASGLAPENRTMPAGGDGDGMPSIRPDLSRANTQLSIHPSTPPLPHVHMNVPGNEARPTESALPALVAGAASDRQPIQRKASESAFAGQVSDSSVSAISGSETASVPDAVPASSLAHLPPATHANAARQEISPSPVAQEFEGSDRLAESGRMIFAAGTGGEVSWEAGIEMIGREQSVPHDVPVQMKEAAAASWGSLKTPSPWTAESAQEVHIIPAARHEQLAPHDRPEQINVTAVVPTDSLPSITPPEIRIPTARHEQTSLHDAPTPTRVTAANLEGPRQAPSPAVGERAAQIPIQQAGPGQPAHQDVKVPSRAAMMNPASPEQVSSGATAKLTPAINIPAAEHAQQALQDMPPPMHDREAKPAVPEHAILQPMAKPIPEPHIPIPSRERLGPHQVEVHSRDSVAMEEGSQPTPPIAITTLPAPHPAPSRVRSAAGPVAVSERTTSQGSAEPAARVAAVSSEGTQTALPTTEAATREISLPTANLGDLAYHDAQERRQHAAPIPFISKQVISRVAAPSAPEAPISTAKHEQPIHHDAPVPRRDRPAMATVLERTTSRATEEPAPEEHFAAAHHGRPSPPDMPVPRRRMVANAVMSEPVSPQITAGSGQKILLPASQTAQGLVAARSVPAREPHADRADLPHGSEMETPRWLPSVVEPRHPSPAAVLASRAEPEPPAIEEAAAITPALPPDPMPTSPAPVTPKRDADPVGLRTEWTQAQPAASRAELAIVPASPAGIAPREMPAGSTARRSDPVVRVSIGRLHIESAPAAPAKPRLFRRPSPSLSLVQYLARRKSAR